MLECFLEIDLFLVSSPSNGHILLGCRNNSMVAHNVHECKFSENIDVN